MAEESRPGENVESRQVSRAGEGACVTCGAPIKKTASGWGYEHDDGRVIAGHIAKPKPKDATDA